jgi:hypothetical protein
MISPFEFFLTKTNVHINSNNRPIIKQIKEYEKKRDRLYYGERGLRILAKQLKRSSMEKSANTLRTEADRLKAEVERLDRNILSLIDKLRPAPSK